MTRRIRLASAITAVAAGTLVVTACSGGDTSSPAPHAGHSGSALSNPIESTKPDGQSFNTADVNFATMMYPHHAQAVEMADMVDGHGASAEVVALAQEIRAAQRPEMDDFTRLLREWGKPAPASESHSGHQMDGMMTDEQMQRLQSLRGPDFDREWLTMMIRHHRGAISMADTELAHGADAEAKNLARRIKGAQQKEIDRMQKLLR